MRLPTKWQRNGLLLAATLRAKFALQNKAAKICASTLQEKLFALYSKEASEKSV
jgi:hypothetical protein